IQAELQGHNVVVLGVSTDPVKRLGKFIERDSLNFSLLSDEDHGDPSMLSLLDSCYLTDAGEQYKADTAPQICHNHS
ncbi:redoxin domain-containing protein, partial [Vibrio cholerae]|uniref:redoxin domain-containing protein n=1 Tax=Vibrio cholerae TaxID=666 RepID=UPI0020CFD5E9